MSLTSLPAVDGSLGPEKVDESGATPGLTDRLYGSEWNVAAKALEEVCAQVGLADGSTVGSIEARLQGVEDNGLTATDGTYTATASAFEDEGQLVARHRATDGTDVAQVQAGIDAIDGPIATALAYLGADPGNTFSGILAKAGEAPKLLGLGAGSGAGIPLNESGHVNLPSGMTSIVQALGLLDTDKLDASEIVVGFWSPTFTPVSNVTTVTSSAWRYVKTRTAVLYYGAPTITPTAAGAISFEIDLPVASDFTLSSHAFGVANGSTLSAGRLVGSASTDRLVFVGERANNVAAACVLGGFYLIA